MSWRTFTNIRLANYDILLTAALVLYAAFIFYPSVHCELTNWDDDRYVINNPLIKSLSIDNIQHILTKTYYENYQPLTLLSFAADYYFFGINSFEMHLINVLLHLLNIVLVYTFIKLLSRDQLISSLTALVFAVHPMRVESVTWITERKDVLYGFFYLASLVFYIKYLFLTMNGSGIYKKSWQFYAVSWLCFILSCLSKGMAVSLPLNLLLIDFFLKRRWNLSCLKDKIPFLAVSFFFGAIAVFATHTQGANELIYSEYLHKAYMDYEPVKRFLFACSAVWFYLYKFFLPFNLSAYYPNLYKDIPLPVYYWFFPIILLAFFLAVFYSLRKTRKVAFGAGFFLISISLILPYHPVNPSLVFDRYSYLGHIGIAFFLSVAFAYCARSKYVQSLLNHYPIHKFTLYIIFAISFVMMGYLTRSRIQVWKNSFTLWTDFIQKNPENFLGYLMRGSALAKEARYMKALEDLTRAIEINPLIYQSFINRANVYFDLKLFEKAMTDYNDGLKLAPFLPEPYFYRGCARWILHDEPGACADWKMASGMGNKSAAEMLLIHCRKL